MCNTYLHSASFRVKSRYVGIVGTHLTGEAYLAQYDEGCAEVETYRQKQVLNASLTPFGRY